MCWKAAGSIKFWSDALQRYSCVYTPVTNIRLYLGVAMQSTHLAKWCSLQAQGQTKSGYDIAENSPILDVNHNYWHPPYHVQDLKCGINHLKCALNCSFFQNHTITTAYIAFCERFSMLWVQQRSLRTNNTEVTTLNPCLVWLLGKTLLLPLVATVKIRPIGNVLKHIYI